MPPHVDQEPIEPVRVHAIVRGRVQGVGFRYATQMEALDIGLCGYVRNRWDGAVEVVAEGASSRVDRLVIWLQHGPRMAHVTQVDVVTQIPMRDFDTFEVRF